MYIYFGFIEKYFPDKGFGFIRHPISLGPKENVFFHISKIERKNTELIEKLTNYKSSDQICFWYISETTKKGLQLSKVIGANEVFHLQHENSTEFIDTIRKLWLNIDKPLKFWMEEVTVGLIGHNHKEEFQIQRDQLVTERNIEIEIRNKERERLKAIEEKKREEQRKILEEQRKIVEQERQKRLAELERQQKLEDEEFELLVAEMKPKRFTMSGQVSNYIIRNRLGDKYKHISGVLEMENGLSSWKFNGGFPPRIYAKLCDRLGLGNKGTNSRVVGFTSFKDLK